MTTTREALQEILRVHANDTVRPKAFYIASAALEAPESPTPVPPKMVGEEAREREAFERWAAGRDLSKDVVFGDYANMYVQSDWETWQGRAALAASAPAAPGEPLEGTPAFRFGRLLSALEERFPGASPFSAEPPEAYYLAKLDALLAAPAAAPQAVGVAKIARKLSDAEVRTAVERHGALSAALDEFLEDYEMIGEDEDGRDACHVPTNGERILLNDAINGLLADDAFIAAFEAWRDVVRRAATPSPAPHGGPEGAVRQAAERVVERRDCYGWSTEADDAINDLRSVLASLRHASAAVPIGEELRRVAELSVERADHYQAESAELRDLVGWAYAKLHARQFDRQDDALMLDRMKLILEHGHG